MMAVITQLTARAEETFDTPVFLSFHKQMIQRKRIQCDSMYGDSYQARLQNVQDPMYHENMDPFLSKMTESLTAVTAES